MLLVNLPQPDPKQTVTQFARSLEALGITTEQRVRWATRTHRRELLALGVLEQRGRSVEVARPVDLLALVVPIRHPKKNRRQLIR